MPGPRSHEENIKLVCAVCTNLNGYKAKRSVVDKDIELIKKHMYFLGFAKITTGFLRASASGVPLIFVS